MRRDPTVFVVDDDGRTRRSLRWLVKSIGLHVETFASAEAFLEAYNPAWPGCLVLDLRMPGMGGLALQNELARRGNEIPIIIVSGFADVGGAVRAMMNGAVVLLEKPYSDSVLLEHVQEALKRDAQSRYESSMKSDVEQRLARLTAREQQIFELLVDGRSSKEIAFALGISQKTVQVHRSRVMTKLGAESIADLVRLALSRPGCNTLS